MFFEKVILKYFFENVFKEMLKMTADRYGC